MKNKIPRWLIIQQEVDYNLFLLRKIYEQESSSVGINALIDEATGMKEKREKEAKKIMAKIKKLKAELYEEEDK